jgi:acyl transferase domain-containing protein/NAD(P)-dependent dehydrogenase (short-subunit alcohol dehydrogenase family)
MDGHTARERLELSDRPERTTPGSRLPRRPGPGPSDIAITGMSAIMPGAANLRRFWENILDKVDAIEEVPTERWPVGLYFDPDRDAQDKINSKWGGFIPEIVFDPTHFRILPASVPSIDPGQLLALVAAEAALADAGLSGLTPEQRRRASVILGFTGGLGELGVQYAARSELGRAVPSVSEETLDFLPRWTSDSFAGLLPNVVAGRIANRFDFGGANFVVDAACAASLAALRQAVMELEAGRSDFVLCGAVETGQGPFAFTCFSKAQALSPTGRCRAFDADADGTTISEGIAMLVLRRLEDAEAAGDRIYAVIKGVDGSSDGRAMSLMAPLPEGQKRAMRSSYDQAGYSPASVELFEAHGTGTVSGDAAEIESLSTLLMEDGAGPHACAVGSVKTLIGHAKGAAGLAGLIKVVLGLHHHVLPPHAGVEQPNTALRRPDCPIALHQQARPWLPHAGVPRRAGVSAFGFGGTNYHVTLEEHAGGAGRSAARDRWPVELFIWRAVDRAGLAAAAGAALSKLQAGATPCLGGLAHALALDLGSGRATLAVVAGSHAALATLLAESVERLSDADGTQPLPQGLYLSDAPLSADGQVAMLFPGQGSQYPDMARELAVTFSDVSAVLEEADAVVADTPTYRGRADGRLSRLVYPFDRFGEEEEEEARSALAATDVAQPALGAVEAALLELITRLGIRPSTVAGHSYGEYAALHAAGVLSRRDLLLLSEARGRSIVNATRDGDLGTMAAVTADAATVAGAIGGDVVVANINAPNQTVISGTRAAVAAAIERLGACGIGATRIPVSAAFHSPLMEPAQPPLVRFFHEIDWAAPRIPVYSNTTSAPHDPEPTRICELLGRHLTEPVDFMGMVEAMYAGGARVFLEVGPKSVLTTLTRSVLGKRLHCAVSLDGAGGGLVGLLHALAALMVQGVRTDLSRLFEGRDLARVDLADWGCARDGSVGQTAAGWLLTGTRARPAHAASRTAAAVRSRSPTSREAHAETAQDTRDDTVTMRQRTPEVAVNDMNGFHSPIGLDDDGWGDPQASGIDRAMADHHQTMRQFLQMQERAMLAYLNAGERAPRPFSTPRSASASRPTMPKSTPAAPLSTRAAERAVAAPAARPVATAAAAQFSMPAARVEPAPATEQPHPPIAMDPKALLLKITCERTGYPENMLGLDLNMEADLGIDSIKRVEILGAFRKAQPTAVSDYLMPRMAHIAKAKTLQEILNSFSAFLLEAQGNERPFDLAGEGHSAATLSRYVIRPTAENLPSSQPAAILPGIYLIGPDCGGIAAALTILLERDGAHVRPVPESAAANDAAADHWLASVRAEGRIRGLISLASAMPPERGPRGTAEWREGMDTSVKSLFALLRLAAPDLASDGIVAVASAMGGYFGRDILRRPERADFFVGAGGGVGLIKCLAAEWPGCLCKAIDLDPDENPAQHAAHIYAEIATPAGRREVGYPRGARTIFRTECALLRTHEDAIEQPDRHWVVLAVGGARGITAETCRPFAASGAVCVVVGRSALPAPEIRATASLADAAALRAFFLAEATTAPGRPTPAKVEARIATVLRDRETRANVADFVALGAHVDYRICDVRREADVEALLESVYARYGRIDAVLFGAGLIEDRLIVDKTRESLSRVFDTKVDGAFFLVRHLRPQTLKFLAFFSSVAGRYGNRGQTDYGAANEVLNRYAWQLQARFGRQVKVTAVNWGPWAKTTNGLGMLTPETARQFRGRGLRLIEPDEGRDFLWNELLYSPRDEVEVVAGEHPWDELEAKAARAEKQGDSIERAVA